MFENWPFFEVLKSRYSFVIIWPLLIILFLLGYVMPVGLEIFQYKDSAQNGILSNLLTGFIAIPSTVLAISAILFAILQVSNRKITIIQMVFQNSYIIPLIYWAITNIAILIFLQLGSDTYTNYHVLRALTCLSYNLLLLLIGLIFTLYRCFRYLDYTNITDDFIEDVYGQLKKEKKPGKSKFDPQQLRQKSKEVYAEIADSIKKDDTIIIEKYLKSFAAALSLNPSSNYLSDFNKNLARWIVNSMKGSSNKTFGAFIQFWRARLNDKIDGKTQFIFSNIDRIPRLSYQMTENDHVIRTAVAYAFAIRLKEIGQKYVYISTVENERIRLGTNFDNLIVIYVEFSELLKYLIAKNDIKTITVVINEISSLRETFKVGKYRYYTSLIVNNRIVGRAADTGFAPEEYTSYLLVKKAVDDVNLILIGNLYWVVFQLFDQHINPAEHSHLIEILNSLDKQVNYNESIQSIVNVFSREDQRFGWDEWIWHGEERLNNKVYTLPSIIDMFGAGFTYTLLKHPDVNIGKHSVTDFQDLKFLLSRAKDTLVKLREAPSFWPELLGLDTKHFNDLVNQLIGKIDQIDDNIENDYSARLVATPISSKKVDEFKQLIYEQWEATRELSKMFEYFDAVIINPQGQLKDSGPNINFTKGRAMFVDGDQYQFIYGIEWGKQVNRGIENRFAGIIKEIALRSKASNLARIFDDGINALVNKGFKPNLILIDIGSFYANELALSGTGNYSSAVNHNNPFPFAIAGFYKNELPIVVLNGIEFSNLIVVAEMPAAMKMKQRQDENNVDRNLIIEINEINRVKAEELIADRQLANQENLTVEELMASMLIHIHQIFDFTVINQDAIRAYFSDVKGFND